MSDIDSDSSQEIAVSICDYWSGDPTCLAAVNSEYHVNESTILYLRISTGSKIDPEPQSKIHPTSNGTLSCSSSLFEVTNVIRSALQAKGLKIKKNSNDTEVSIYCATSSGPSAMISEEMILRGTLPTKCVTKVKMSPICTSEELKDAINLVSTKLFKSKLVTIKRSLSKRG